MYGCFVYMHIGVPLARLLFMEARRGYGSPGIGVTDSSKLHCTHWELNQVL